MPSWPQAIVTPAARSRGDGQDREVVHGSGDEADPGIGQLTTEPVLDGLVGLRQTIPERLIEQFGGARIGEHAVLREGHLLDGYPAAEALLRRPPRAPQTTSCRDGSARQ